MGSSNTSASPPKFALIALRWFCKPEYHPDIEGDLLQLYERRAAKHGQKIARKLFYKDVLQLFRPGIIRSITISQKLNIMDQLKHNIKISFRGFNKHRSSFLINLLGLSSGLGCVLFIYLWVADELAMDQYHERGDNLYQLLENVDQATGQITRITTAGPTAKALAEEFPEVEKAVTATWVMPHTLSVEEKHMKANGIYASEDFFDLFTLNILEGGHTDLLSKPNNIVISDELGRKLFGSDQNLIGKQIKWRNEEMFQISGVFEKLPKTSSLQYDLVLPFLWFWQNNEWVQNWYNTAARTYMLLKPNTDITALNEKLKTLVIDKTEGNASHRSPFAAKYQDRYLYGNYENGVQSGGRIEYVKLFAIIALFILVVACINFMNLSTARAARRLKEVGIKKTVGATRGTLAFQYLSESIILVFCALIIALGVVWVLLPQFNFITNKELALVFDARLIQVLGISLLLTGILAGSYPAIYLSGFNPAKVLKGKLNKSVGETWTRKGLVTFQFALSFILIVSVVVIYKQIQFTQTQNLGYSQENVIFFDIIGSLTDSTRFQTFKNQVENLPGVQATAGSNHNMTGHNGGTYGLHWPGKDPNDRTEFERMFVSRGFMELLDVQIIEGRDFSNDLSSDSDKIIFNEAAIALIGFEDPIGKKVILWGDEVEIIGMVKDFHFDSFHETIKPIFLKLTERPTDYLMVKSQPGKERELLADLDNLHKNLNPGFDLDYRFLDENYQQLYEAESRVAILSRYFAGLAIIISCLGLFGLASFTLERRSKEIGIRKALGCGNFSLAGKLSSELTNMVLIAIFIGMPVSYLAASSWLESFAFRIDLEWWFFLGAGVITLIIALLTVSFQAFKAATLNPVRYLRDE